MYFLINLWKLQTGNSQKIINSFKVVSIFHIQSVRGRGRGGNSNYWHYGTLHMKRCILLRGVVKKTVCLKTLSKLRLTPLPPHPIFDKVLIMLTFLPPLEFLTKIMVQIECFYILRPISCQLFEVGLASLPPIRTMSLEILLFLGHH